MSASETLVISAKIALKQSDAVLQRIVEAVIAGRTTFDASDVVTWPSYRATLRAIMNGTDTASTVLPATPPYPTGT